jgi:hypothetical protein
VAGIASRMWLLFLHYDSYAKLTKLGVYENARNGMWPGVRREPKIKRRGA